MLCNSQVHLSRRTLLSAGAAWSMSSLARKLAYAEAQGIIDPTRPKSVILLWLEGGPSQLETFDPHVGSPIGGDAKSIATSIPKVQISDLLPQTAEQMHLATLVRSVVGEEGEHNRAVYQIKSGFRPDPTLVHPAIGAILCDHDRVEFDIPRHISILPGNAPARGGFLGGNYDAFKIGDPAGPVTDVARRVDSGRFDQRLDDLNSIVEKEFARGRLADLERSRTLHRSATDAALRMMSSEQLTAFNVSDEPKAELERFGDTAFGRGCLAASRLIEVGARCVEVTLGGWDSHVTNHTLQASACSTLDPALAALLQRLKERDLLDSTVVLCGGEFGRTPQINPAEGRDHWPHGFSVLMAGGGFRSGYVHGATAADPKLDASNPHQDVESPVTVSDLHATLLHTLGVDPGEELDTPIGRPMKRSEGKVIHELIA